MDQASGAVYLESWQKRGVARLEDASGSTASRIWSISFMRFRIRCNLETAPNIGELSSIGPLLEWNVPVFPMARRSRGGPPDLWALCILSVTALCTCIYNKSQGEGRK